MRFRTFLEGQPVTLPLTSLILRRSEVQFAAANILRGLRSQTDGPLEVAQFPDGTHQLTNGYHRLVELLLAGDDTVRVTVKPAQWNPPPEAERFHVQPDLPHQGLEDILEPWQLRRL